MHVFYLVIGLLRLLQAQAGPVYAFQDPVIQSSTCTSPYIVQDGDSLRKIARKCQVSARNLIEANPEITNPDLILVGQRIRLPSSLPPPGSARGAIALHDGGEETTPGGNALGENAPAVEQTSAAGADQNPARDELDQYTIQRGDTLGKIAKRLGTSVRQLVLINPEIPNPNRIYPGHVLRVPAPGSVLDEQAWLELRVEQAAQKKTGYDPGANERWVFVDVATQSAHAFEGDRVVRSFLVSTGTSRFPTVTGTYRIWIKFLHDDMRGPGYYLEDVPYVLYFYKGYGLHGTTWHDNFGTPMSHGCVNLSVEDAAWLYDFASVGTVVRVQ